MNDETENSKNSAPSSTGSKRSPIVSMSIFIGRTLCRSGTWLAERGVDLIVWARSREA